MAITYVNSAQFNDKTGGTVSTFNFPAFNCSGDNLLVIGSAAGTISSISDTAGNTYIKAITFSGAGRGEVQMWYCPKTISNASNVVTVNFSPAGGYVGACIAQYTNGGSTGFVLDKTAYGTQSSPVTSIATSSFTTTIANEVIVAYATQAVLSGTLTAGTGYTKRVNSSSGTDALEDKIVTSIQTGETAVMTSSTNEGFSIAALTFYEASSISSLTDYNVAYYKLDNVNDSVGTNHLTNNNTTTFIAGKIENGGNFVASSSQSLSSTTSPVSSYPMSVSLWVKANSTTGPFSLWSNGNTGTTNTYQQILIDSGHFYVVSRNTTFYGADGGTFSAGTWYHIVGVWESSVSRKIYVNGSLVATDINTAAFPTVNKNGLGFLSNSGAQYYHNGMIDEVGIWNRVLTSTEITSLYNSGNGNQYPFPTTTAYTLTADTGVLTLTGYAATLGLTSSLLAETGALFLRGYDAVLSYVSESIWANKTKNSTTWTNRSKGNEDIILATPYPEDSAIAWSVSAGTYTNNTTLSPTGTLTADTLNFTLGNNASWDMYKQFSGFTPLSFYKVSMWVKLGTATNFSLVVNDTTAWNTIGGQVFTTSDGLSTTAWKQISYYWTQPTAKTNINLHLGANSNNLTNQTAGSVYIWGVQIDRVASLTPVMSWAEKTKNSTTWANKSKS